MTHEEYQEYTRRIRESGLDRSTVLMLELELAAVQLAEDLAERGQQITREWFEKELAKAKALARRKSSKK